MTTANKITILRMILVPVLVILMYLDFPGHIYWALAVFVIASISDSMDRELISRSLSATEYLFANTLERTANQAARGHPAATAMVSHPFPEGRKENTMELLKATANSRIRETRLLAKRTFPSCMAIWVFPLRRNDEQML